MTEKQRELTYKEKELMIFVINMITIFHYLTIKRKRCLIFQQSVLQGIDLIN